MICYQSKTFLAVIPEEQAPADFPLHTVEEESRRGSYRWHWKCRLYKSKSSIQNIMLKLITLGFVLTSWSVKGYAVGQTPIAHWPKHTEEFIALAELLANDVDKKKLDLLIEYTGDLGTIGEYNLVTLVSVCFLDKPEAVKIFQRLLKSRNDTILISAMDEISSDYVGICGPGELSSLKIYSHSKNSKIKRAALESLTRIEQFRKNEAQRKGV